MRLKRLCLRNIRSYREAEVEFPDGILLFEGDIGSGKSTLLYAVELALFGPAEGDTRKKKDFYLRGGEKEGWVRLDVEVGGKEYSFHRELTRAGPGKCKVLADGGFTEYAPTEMRARVLEILGFNEPSGARASSVIYRYAVFTPQDEMKQVLYMKEDDRIQTLRKAFRIEDYKLARESGELAAREFRARSFELENRSSEVEELRRRSEALSGTRRQRAEELSSSQGELAAAAELRAGLDAELRELELQKERREKLLAGLQRLADRMLQLQGWLSSAEEEVKGLRSDARRLEDLRPRVEEDLGLSRRLDGLEESLRERRELELGLARARQDLRAVAAELTRAEERNKELEEVRARMEPLRAELEDLGTVRDRYASFQAEEAKLRERLERASGDMEELSREKEGYRELGKGQKCPKCGQELSPAHLDKVLGDLERKRGRCLKDHDELSSKLVMREEKMRAGRRRLEELEGKRSELGKLEGAAKQLASELARVAELMRTRARLEKEVSEGERLLEDRGAEAEAKRLRSLRPGWEQRKAELAGLQGRLAGLARRENEISHHREELAGAGEARAKLEADAGELARRYDEGVHLRKAEERERVIGRLHHLEGVLTRLRREIEELDAERGRLASELSEREGALHRLGLYREGASWLGEFFSPALEAMERQVLSQVNSRFDELFRDWFGMLSEGTELEVTIDEDFSPVVQQGGLELDILSLSGGEKTSVAFAYRLALNHMVREVSGVDRDNLLILDEPTDGFSREQLARVREVIRALKAPQLILVSHERELESFADRVFRVVKEGGVSRVEPLGK